MTRRKVTDQRNDIMERQEADLEATQDHHIPDQVGATALSQRRGSVVAPVSPESPRRTDTHQIDTVVVKISTSLANVNTDLVVAVSHTVCHQITSLVIKRGPRIKTGTTKIEITRKTGRNITHLKDCHVNTETVITSVRPEIDSINMTSMINTGDDGYLQ